MKRMKKILIVTIVSIFLSSFFVCADEGISVEKAIHSGRIQFDYLNKISIENAKFDVDMKMIKNFETTYDKIYEDKLLPTREENSKIEGLIFYDVKKIWASHKFKLSVYLYEKNIKSIIAYLMEMDLVNDINMLKYENKMHEFLLEKEINAAAQLNNGIISEIDKQIIVSEVQQCAAKIQVLKNDIEGKKIFLNNFLGEEVTTYQTALTRSQIARVKYYQRKGNSRIELENLKLNEYLNRIDLEKFKSIQKILSNSEIIKIKKIKIQNENIQNELESKRSEINEEIKKAIGDYYTSVEKYKLTLDALIIADKALKNLQVTYELGKIKKEELLSAELIKLKAENNKIIAAMNCNLIARKILFASSIGPSYNYDYSNMNKED